MRALTNPTELESSWLLPILPLRAFVRFCHTTETPGYSGGASMLADGEESRRVLRLDLQTQTATFASKSMGLFTTLTGSHGCMSLENGRAATLTISTETLQTTDGQTCVTLSTRQTLRTGVVRTVERSLDSRLECRSTNGTGQSGPTSRWMERRTALVGTELQS